jgi:hypothetical protein
VVTDVPGSRMGERPLAVVQSASFANKLPVPVCRRLACLSDDGKFRLLITHAAKTLVYQMTLGGPVGKQVHLALPLENTPVRRE